MDPHRLAEARSLAYHRVIAERLATGDDAVMRARTRIEEWQARKLIGERYVETWKRLLLGPREILCARLAADDEEARALRQTTPFAGVLEPAERWEIWRRVGREHR